MVTTTTDLDVHASEQVLKAVGAESDDELRFLLVAKLFELGRVSTGRGAELCGLPIVIFMQKLSAIGIPVISYPVEELREELRDVDV